MFLCQVKFSPPLHHIICVVLLLFEASLASPVNDTLTATASVPRHSTPADCLSCDNVSSNATAENSSQVPTLPSAKNLTFTPRNTMDEVKSTLPLPTDRPAVQPKTPSEPPALTRSNSTLPTNGTSAATTTSDSTVTSASTTNSTRVLQEATTETVNETETTSRVTTTTETQTTKSLTTTKRSTSSPPPSSSATIKPTASTPLALAPTTVGIALPSTSGVSSATAPETSSRHSKLAPSVTTAAMVEVLGAALSRQLASTALLGAALVCGCLLFVITVLLFVKQACYSYSRKDYSQVDYLINGMYNDSSV